MTYARLNKTLTDLANSIPDSWESEVVVKRTGCAGTMSLTGNVKVEISVTSTPGIEPSDFKVRIILEAENAESER